ncbi:MAG: sodium/proline symporter [Spirochaetia bacterium]|nr:sodium/proline symporter [Spirochaetia bacterium]
MILTSFLFFLFLFLAIGILSVFKRKNTTEDYLIAGKSVSPLLVGLSAVATNNSGFMFIGMIGVTYMSGLSSIWLMIGWIAGDLLASFLAVDKIQKVSRNSKIHSFGGLLSHWNNTDFKKLRLVAGILTVFFLTVYAAAQLKAGSKAAEALLGWQSETGVIISALIVLVYSAVGGIRASIWTDVAQSVVMIIGMSLLFAFGVEYAGGVNALLSKLSQVKPAYLNFFPEKNFLEIFLFIAGWIFGGFAVIGQPHIVIRFMSLDKFENINRMRLYYYIWFALFYGLTIIVGLISRVVISDVAGFDAEMALPNMALALFPEILTGIILAALFAATMSTADSLILACSASVTRDIFQKSRHTLFITKFSTFMVLLTAVFIALTDNKTVFALVLDAWGMLASAFAPLIVLYSLKKEVSENAALSMLLTGLFGFILFNKAGFGSLIYSAAPGIISGFLVFYAIEAYKKYRIKSISQTAEEFDS